MNRRTCYVPGCQRQAEWSWRRFPLCNAHVRIFRTKG